MITVIEYASAVCNGRFIWWCFFSCIDPSVDAGTRRIKAIGEGWLMLGDYKRCEARSQSRGVWLARYLAGLDVTIQVFLGR